MIYIHSCFNPAHSCFNPAHRVSRLRLPRQKRNAPWRRKWKRWRKWLVNSFSNSTICAIIKSVSFIQKHSRANTLTRWVTSFLCIACGKSSSRPSTSFSIAWAEWIPSPEDSKSPSTTSAYTSTSSFGRNKCPSLSSVRSVLLAEV